MGMKNESYKHKRTKQLIYEMGMLKVKDLHIYDDICLTTDYHGFEKDVFVPKFGAGVLLKGGTLVFDTVEVECNIKKRFGLEHDIFPDLFATIGNSYYAIEIVYKHDLTLNRADYRSDEDYQNSLYKLKAYFSNGINVIKVYVNNITSKQIEKGQFSGEWYLSNYAQVCKNKIWSVTFPAVLKDVADDWVNDYNDDRNLLCYKNVHDAYNENTNAFPSPSQITVRECKECTNCIYGVYADGQNRVFTKEQSSCIHCYECTTHFNSRYSGRKGKWSTFKQFLTTLMLDYLNSTSLFDKTFAERYKVN